jgi:hypothetical protein
MSLPKHIVGYHNRKEEMILELRDDTENILNAIDLDDLLNDPNGYLTLLGTAFLDKHQDKFTKAFNMGVSLGEKM